MARILATVMGIALAAGGFAAQASEYGITKGLTQGRTALAQAAQMPFIIGLHVQGHTLDGTAVRLNVPIELLHEDDAYPSELADRPREPIERARLAELTGQLEQVFSEEFDQVSRMFRAADFYAAVPATGCRYGSAGVCATVHQQFQAALARAQFMTRHQIRIVDQWVSFYGFFGAAPANG